MSENCAVNNPKHYCMGTIEVIDFIEDQKLPYHAANAIKYICRYRWKGKPAEDLRKAAWYCTRLANLIEEEIKDAKRPQTDTNSDAYNYSVHYWDTERNR
jgi:hypothetical protein